MGRCDHCRRRIDARKSDGGRIASRWPAQQVPASASDIEDALRQWRRGLDNGVVRSAMSWCNFPSQPCSYRSARSSKASTSRCRPDRGERTASRLVFRLAQRGHSRLNHLRLLAPIWDSAASLPACVDLAPAVEHSAGGVNPTTALSRARGIVIRYPRIAVANRTGEKYGVLRRPGRAPRGRGRAICVATSSGDVAPSISRADGTVVPSRVTRTATSSRIASTG